MSALPIRTSRSSCGFHQHVLVLSYRSLSSERVQPDESPASQNTELTHFWLLYVIDVFLQDERRWT